MKIRTDLNEKTREAFCHLVKYGMKTKELHLLSGYSKTWTRVKILRCKFFKK